MLCATEPSSSVMVLIELTRPIGAAGSSNCLPDSVAFPMLLDYKPDTGSAQMYGNTIRMLKCIVCDIGKLVKTVWPGGGDAVWYTVSPLAAATGMSEGRLREAFPYDQMKEADPIGHFHCHLRMGVGFSLVEEAAQARAERAWQDGGGASSSWHPAWQNDSGAFFLAASSRARASCACAVGHNQQM